jgi:hypothetical protein
MTTRKWLSWGALLLGSAWLVGCGVTKAQIDPIVTIWRLVDGVPERVLVSGNSLTVPSGTLVKLEADLDDDVPVNLLRWSSTYSSKEEFGYEFSETFERPGTFRVRFEILGQSETEIVIQVGDAEAPPPVSDITLDWSRIIVTGGSWVDGRFRFLPGGISILDCGGAVSGGRGPYRHTWYHPDGYEFSRGSRLVCSDFAWLVACCGERRPRLVICDQDGFCREFIFIIVIVEAENPTPAPPVVELLANGSDGGHDGVVEIPASAGGTGFVRLSWEVEGEFTELVGSGVNFSGPLPLTRRGERDFPLTAGTVRTFTLLARGPGGEDADSVTVRVGHAPIPCPEVTVNSFTYSSGMLAWGSSNADACEIDGPVDFGTLGQAGAQAASVPGTYTIECWNDCGERSSSRTVTIPPVTPPPGNPPVVAITWPLDGSTHVRTGNPRSVTVAVEVQVWGGTPPFTYRVKFPDEHLTREQVRNDRAWEISKTFSAPSPNSPEYPAETHQIYAEVEDAEGRVSNRDSIVVNVN